MDAARKPFRSSARARRKRRREEGAVMLVVMLILLVATASATVSVQTTQSELHAAGHDRMALQARYAAEAAMLATTTWIDDLGSTAQWEGIWNDEQAKPVPIMNLFGEPNIVLTDRHFAMRTTQLQQAPQHAGEMESIGPPGLITDPAPVDLLGSFGPNQAYQPVSYAVDFTDCVPAPAALTPGQPTSGSGPTFVQYFCTLTARGRVQIGGAGSGLTRDWVYDSVTFQQDAFMAAHDVRATVLLPEVMRP
jgi:hypothetical protein